MESKVDGEIVQQEKWMKHYSSNHQILLVGEGDFSFAACLANTFGRAPNIIATSLLTHGELIAKHPTSAANLKALEDRGSTIIYEVNVCTMNENPSLKHILFDRIVFNFPHAGFQFREHDMCQILLHKNVVSGFLKSAGNMLRTHGEVHITHKITNPFNKWEIEQLGEEAGLRLIERAPFDIWEYPGYVNRRGGDSIFRNSNDTFPVGECRTFKFVK